jgi:uncharacterized membrane protein YfcA
MDITLIMGVLVGVVLGLTGAGGGILAVPALIAGMGWPMQQATPVALVAVAGSAALGAIEGFRKKLVRYKAAILMALAGIPFTSLGVRIAQLLSQRLLISLFAVVMLIVAFRLIRQTYAVRVDEHTILKEAPCHVSPDNGRFQWTWITALLLGSVGALTGLMTGMLGVGGGFIIVPALRKLTDLSMHGIVATSLMVIALVGTGGVISAVAHGVQLPPETTAFFTMACAFGMLVGRGLVAHIPERIIQQTFSYVLIAIAIGLLFKSNLNG